MRKTYEAVALTTVVASSIACAVFYQAGTDFPIVLGLIALTFAVLAVASAMVEESR